MSDPYLTLVEAASQLAARRCSSEELTRATLRRIEAVDAIVHSFLIVDHDGALDAARRADTEIRAGRRRGPLHGIPVAVKDLFDVAGLPTTANSRTLEGHRPASDAAVVARLRGAGAVIVGKLQMNEFAMGAVSEADFRPPVRNPWDPSRTTGGSSSGSAGALAAGLCYGSYGSDTGGSIRGPASHTGVVGLKPTNGLVSRRGVAILSWSLDAVGPMARSVFDVAVLLQATAGHDPADPSSARVAIPDYLAAARARHDGRTIGVPRRAIDVAGVAPDVLASFDAALLDLERDGFSIRDVEIDDLDVLDASYDPILLGEAAANHHRALRDGAPYGDGFRRRVAEGFLYTAVDYVQAQRGRALLEAAVRAALDDVDVLAMPTTDRTAATFADYAAGRGSPFTRLFNLTGHPSLSVPSGFDRHGLPVGLLLSGRHFDEATVLEVAGRLEAMTNHHERHPVAISEVARA